MQKRILKKIAKEWCAGILLACEGDSFDEDVDGFAAFKRLEELGVDLSWKP